MIYSEYKDNKKETIENITDGIWSNYGSCLTLTPTTVHGKNDKNDAVSITRMQYRRYENNMSLLCYLLQNYTYAQRQMYYTISEEQIKDHLPSRKSYMRTIELLDYFVVTGIDSNTDSDGEMANSR